MRHVHKEELLSLEAPHARHVPLANASLPLVFVSPVPLVTSQQVPTLSRVICAAWERQQQLEWQTALDVTWVHLGVNLASALIVLLVAIKMEREKKIVTTVR